jgi:outer membrane protein insertion porin family
MRFVSTFTFLLAGIFALGPVVPTLSAQQQGSEQTYPVVNEILTEFKGFRSVSDQYVFGNVQLRAGMNYNPALVDQSIRTLYATGQFEFVEVRVEKAEGDQVNVIIELVSKYTIQRIRFLGNESYSDSRLASKAELETGLPLDEYLVSLGAEKITEYYVEKGYPDVEVDYRIERNEQNGYATVSYDIDEGGEVRIDEIIFEGNEAFSDKELLKQLETKEQNLFLSWITGAGKFDEKKFKEDLTTLRKFYRDFGYLDCEIDESQISIDFIADDEINITIPVVEGQLYYLGSFSVENATIYTEDELLRVVDLKSPVRPFSPQAVDDACDCHS